MTREEAINVVRNIYQTDKEKEALVVLIPELAESDDERIRKEIIDYLGLVGKGDGDYAQPMIDRWIAYLEKQKEQKPYEPKNWPADKDALTQEQKPTEWSDEDEHRRKDAIYFLESAMKHYADTSEIEKTIAWLKSFHPQPKVEWSEEDEKMLNRIIDILNRTFSVYSALGTSSTRPSCPTYKDEITWLKSLRPQPRWKPSEEQMAALVSVTKNLFAEMPERHRLESLYEQLKKLM